MGINYNNNILNFEGFINSTTFEELMAKFETRFLLPFRITYDVTEEDKEKWLSLNKNYKADPEYTYSFNKWQFRDHDFLLDAEILCFGCSVTYGVGVPIEHRWSNVLAEKFNLKSNNFGIPGLSTVQMYLMYSSLIKFIKPKIAVFCLPDYQRELLSFSKDDGAVKFFQGFNNYNEIYQPDSEQFKVSKLYYNLPLTFRLDSFVNHVHLICRLSEVLKIKTHICTWNFPTYQILKDLKIDSFSNCNLIKYIPRDFSGRDFKHPGIGYHHNLAEAIYNSRFI